MERSILDLVTIPYLRLPIGKMASIQTCLPFPAYGFVTCHPPEEGEPHSVARPARELRPVRQQSSDDIVLSFIAPAHQ
jgi:hypothetical protein